MISLSQFEKNDLLTSLGLSSLDLLECNDRYIVFHMPSAPLATEILVSLRLSLVFAGHKYGFSATGKIIDQKKLDNGSCIYRLQLRQFDKSLWQKFLKASDGESLRVDRIFKAIKGES